MTLENYQLVERTKALYGHMFTLLVGTSAVAMILLYCSGHAYVMKAMRGEVYQMALLA